MNLKEARERVAKAKSGIMNPGDDVFWESTYPRSTGFLEGYEAGVKEASNCCDVDWPLGIVGNSREYATSESLKKRILKLLEREDEGTLLEEGK